MTSSLDTWDQNTQIDYAFNPASPGVRPSWTIPAIGILNEAVNSINSSTATPEQFISPTLATAAGMALNPFTNSTVFKVVPNMVQTIYTTAGVQISISMNASTNAVPDSADFAIFRDGQKISQVYQITTSVVFVAVPVNITYVDTSPARNVVHVYDLRWHRGAHALIANGRNRTFQVSNLMAQ
jgi:hypothetical protein